MCSVRYLYYSVGMTIKADYTCKLTQVLTSQSCLKEIRSVGLHVVLQMCGIGGDLFVIQQAAILKVVVSKVGRGWEGNRPVEEPKEVELHLLELFLGIVVRCAGAELSHLYHHLDGWKALVCLLKLGYT